ncbi:hypothetical protein ABD76_27735 [Paenibacillus dendritiformis]|nr:hypothetical protein [Paenibacillus dendritiformis]
MAYNRVSSKKTDIGLGQHRVLVFPKLYHQFRELYRIPNRQPFDQQRLIVQQARLQTQILAVVREHLI